MTELLTYRGWEEGGQDAQVEYNRPEMLLFSCSFGFH